MRSEVCVLNFSMKYMCLKFQYEFFCSASLPYEVYCLTAGYIFGLEFHASARTISMCNLINIIAVIRYKVVYSSVEYIVCVCRKYIQDQVFSFKVIIQFFTFLTTIFISI